MNAEEYLKQLNAAIDVRDAQIIVAQIIERPRTWLLAHLDIPLTTPQLDAANEAFDQLQAGIPLPYIIGHWEFFGLNFQITKDVLIPRPETELLVEKAILWLQDSKERRMIADIGTGCGAIAVTLANIFQTSISSQRIFPPLHYRLQNEMPINSMWKNKLNLSNATCYQTLILGP